MEEPKIHLSHGYAFTDMRRARQVIAEYTGGRWLWSGVRGRASIARDQVKLKLARARGARR